MKTVLVLTLLSLTLNLLPEFAQAGSYITYKRRCTEQNLGPEEGRQRNLWARKCFPTELADIQYHDSKSPREYALVSDAAETNFNAPFDVNAPCDGNWQIMAFCVASCYTPEQEILFGVGYLPVVTASASRQDNLITLTADSREDALHFQETPVESYTISFRDGNETILALSTQSGGNLRVTPNHPMVLAGGIVKPAADLVPGDLLIQMSGDLDPITSIGTSRYFGKVYNVAPDSNDPLENILVAQGFLSGSANYQYKEQFQDLRYRSLLRSKIRIDE